MSTILREYINKDTSGRNRLFVEFECDFCKCNHSKQKRFVTEFNYCSQKCSGDSKKHKYSTEYSCTSCNTKIFRNPSKQKCSKSGLFFCTKKCRNEAQKLKNGIESIWPSHYGTSNGKNSYRELALETFTHKCNNCGYNRFLKLLHVHHIDENRTNNRIDNLELLCPTCHLEKHLINKSGSFTCCKD